MLKRGLLETSDGGSLFLDEIAELSLPAQSQAPQGPSKRRPSGAWVGPSMCAWTCASSPPHHRRSVRPGPGEEDSALTSFIGWTSPHSARSAARADPRTSSPWLREFLRESAERMGKALFRILASKQERKLRSHNYPGNVRELANLVERGDPGRRTGGRRRLDFTRRPSGTDHRGGDDRAGIEPA